MKMFNAHRANPDTRRPQRTVRSSRPHLLSRRTRLCAVTCVVALVSVVSPAAAAADPNAQEPSKVGANSKSTASSTGAHASTLGEENALRAVADALPTTETPGLFTSDPGRPTVRVFADRSEHSAKSKLSRHGATTAKSQFTTGSLRALSARLENASRRAGVSYQFYYDAESDTVAVTGNLTAEDLRGIPKGHLTFTPSAGLENQSRYYDTAPFWGGAAIYRPDGARCSTAFVVKNGAGTRYMVTAGHCGAVGTTWRTAGGVYVGQTVSRPNYPAYDMELIGGGSSYGSYIYMGDATGYGSKVLGAGDPVVGVYYCMSGTTTNENCNKKVTSLSATHCASDGCVYGLASYTGGALTQGGDSGGPLVLKSSSGVYARGLHRGISGSTMYGERWQSVASLFGVSIVT